MVPKTDIHLNKALFGSSFSSNLILAKRRGVHLVQSVKIVRSNKIFFSFYEIK